MYKRVLLRKKPVAAAPAGYDYTQADGGFIGTITTDWIEGDGTNGGAVGSLVSVKDLGSAQLFTAGTDEVNYTTGNKFFENDGNQEAQIDTNDGNSTHLSPGSGTFTHIAIMRWEGDLGGRHINFQNNASQNTIKFTSSGIEFRANGFSSEDLAFSFVGGTVYFIAVQRITSGAYRAWVATTEASLPASLGTTTGTNSTDLGGVNNIRMGETEAWYGWLVYNSELSESTISDIFEQAKLDFPLG